MGAKKAKAKAVEEDEEHPSKANAKSAIICGITSGTHPDLNNQMTCGIPIYEDFFTHKPWVVPFYKRPPSLDNWHREKQDRRVYKYGMMVYDQGLSLKAGHWLVPSQREKAK